MRLRFAEVPDRSTAEALRGRYLVADVEAGLPPGHHYWHELVGIPVRDETGRVLGRVAEVYRAGGAEVVSLAGGPFGPLEVPLVSGIVRVLDPAGEGLVVDAVALGLEPSEDDAGPPTVEAEAGPSPRSRGRPGREARLRPAPTTDRRLRAGSVETPPVAPERGDDP